MHESADALRHVAAGRDAWRHPHREAAHSRPGGAKAEPAVYVFILPARAFVPEGNPCGPELSGSCVGLTGGAKSPAPFWTAAIAAVKSSRRTLSRFAPSARERTPDKTKSRVSGQRRRDSTDGRRGRPTFLPSARARVMPAHRSLIRSRSNSVTAARIAVTRRPVAPDVSTGRVTVENATPQRSKSCRVAAPWTAGAKGLVQFPEQHVVDSVPTCILDQALPVGPPPVVGGTRLIHVFASHLRAPSGGVLPQVA